MKEKIGVKLCIIFIVALIIFSLLPLSSMALTRQDVITRFLAQKDIKDFTDNMSYVVTATPNENSGIDLKIEMGIENYKTTFVFDGDTCKITLKSEADELGKVLLKNMWAACAEIGNEAGVRTEAITGETGENALDNFWTKFTEKVNNGEETYVAYGVKIEKESDGSYVGTINTRMYQVNLTDLTSVTYESKNNNNNNNKNNSSNNTVKNTSTNVTRIPNAGNNNETINFFKTIAVIAVIAVIAFSIYNVKSKK